MKHNLLLGVVLSLFAALAYSSQTALIKIFAEQLPALPIVIFIQSLTSLLLILPVLLKRGPVKAIAVLSTQKMNLHILRALFGLSISYLLFYAVIFIPLVNALLLANTAPLVIPFIGYVFLSQKINHHLWIPLLIGFTGVSLILHPDSTLFHPAAFLAMGAAASLSLSMLIVRKLAATEATVTTLFYFFLFSTLLSGVISLPFWTPLSPPVLLVITAIGTLYFMTQYASTLALKYVNAQLFGSLFYANIVYATIISLLLWNTLPTTTTLLGTALIIAGGILCIRTEHRHHLKLKQPERCYVTES